jgi:ABC-2 type transport system permease protein
MFTGFQAIGDFKLLGDLDNFIIKLGINDHYVSLSKGLIDSRDLVYFITLISVFILLTRAVLQSRKW